MPTRKMRVELLDSDGNRYTVSFEGQITREKALRLLDLVELLGGMPSGGSNSGVNVAPAIGNEVSSKYDKVRVLVQRHFPLVWFSSREVQSVYEREFKEPINLSTVGTYLSRMTNRGTLVKAGSANSLKYKLVTSIPDATIKQQIP